MTPIDELEQAVGRNMPNLPADIKRVQEWLDRWSHTAHDKGDALERRMHQQEQVFSERLHQAIQQFQREILGKPTPSGKVHPGDETAKKLKHPAAPRRTPQPAPAGLPVHPAPGTPLVLPKRRGFEPLNVADYERAAKSLGCETNVIRALGLQEGGKHGFDSQNRPIILYEPVHFARYSQHPALYRKKYPALTHIKPKPHPYGNAKQQWEWLDQAYLIDPRSALLAPSWGKFQILGVSYPQAGFPSVQAFVSAMCESEQRQLDAFIEFIKNKNLEKALQDKNWQDIASGYNGTHWRSRKFGPPGHEILYDQALEDKYNALQKEGH